MEAEKNNLEENNINSNNNLEKKTKNLVAREFVYFIIVGVTCILLALSGQALKHYRYNKNRELEKIESSFPQNNLLWYKLTNAGLYKKNYADFKKDYKNSADQIILYHLVKNNSLLPKGYDENKDNISRFRKEIFYSDYILDICFRIYKNDDYYYIDYRPVEDKEWNELFVSKDDFKEKLKDIDILNKIYKTLVVNGFSETFEYFKMIIFEPKEQEITKDEFVKFNLLEKEVEFHNDMDYEELFLKIIIFVIILFYPCRYLFLILKWSIRQIKK